MLRTGISDFPPMTGRLNGVRLADSTNVNALSTSRFDFRALWNSLHGRRTDSADEALDWTGYIDKNSDMFPVGVGQFGEVYKAVWKNVPVKGLPPIAIKVIRPPTENAKLKRMKESNSRSSDSLGTDHSHCSMLPEKCECGLS